LTRQAARTIAVKLNEYLFNGGFLDEFLGEVKILVIGALLVVEPAANPFDEGNIAELGSLHGIVLIFHC